MMTDISENTEKDPVTEERMKTYPLLLRGLLMSV